MFHAPNNQSQPLSFQHANAQSPTGQSFGTLLVRHCQLVSCQQFQIQQFNQPPPPFSLSHIIWHCQPVSTTSRQPALWKISSESFSRVFKCRNHQECLESLTCLVTNKQFSTLSLMPEGKKLLRDSAYLTVRRSSWIYSCSAFEWEVNNTSLPSFRYQLSLRIRHC